MTAPRPYHHGNLRTALLQAAERAVEAGGTRNVSLRELSRALGVSHASPRRHFAGRQALLDALAASGFDRFEAALGRATRPRGRASFQTRLTRLAQAYVAFALQHPALFALMFEAKHRPDAPPALLESSAKAFAHGPAIFAEGQATGEVVPGDPGRLSLVVFAALQGLVAIATDGRFKGIGLDTLAKESVERIVSGICPRK